jgi:NADPH:quinone reductase-like Zn-dependent oxidoreductase
MKAIEYRCYGGPEVLELVDRPDPAPGPGEVLIHVHAVSLAPGDWKMRRGLLKDVFPARFPVTPGRDGSGEVAALGAGVADVAPGDGVVFMTDRVTAGSYAELIVRKRDAIVRKPASVSHIEAAAANHAGLCAWLGLVDTARIGPGSKVLIHGAAGAVGSFAVQLAHHRGAKVAATCRAGSVEYVAALGAHTVIAYDRDDFAAILRDYDVVYDLVGGAVHERSYRVLKQGGLLLYLIAKPVVERGAEYGVAVKRVAIDERPDAIEAVMALVAAGAVKPQVDRVFPLAEAAAAHRFLESNAPRRGRCVLQVR